MLDRPRPRIATKESGVKNPNAPDFVRDERMRLSRMQACYGYWFPTKYNIEKKILHGVQRLGGLESSHVGLDFYTGELHNLRAEDYLNIPANDARISTPFHSVMEQKILGESIQAHFRA
eukprot:RCo019773